MALYTTRRCALGLYRYFFSSVRVLFLDLVGLERSTAVGKGRFLRCARGCGVDIFLRLCTWRSLGVFQTPTTVESAEVLMESDTYIADLDTGKWRDGALAIPIYLVSPRSPLRYSDHA